MEGGAVGHILKGNHPGTIPARFGLIWYISAERNPEYMLNYFLPCSAVKI